MQPTFISKHIDGAVILQCRETGERYSFRETRAPFPVYREGKIICYRNSRSAALSAIESNARWSLREFSLG